MSISFVNFLYQVSTMNYQQNISRGREEEGEQGQKGGEMCGY